MSEACAGTDPAEIEITLNGLRISGGTLADGRKTIQFSDAETGSFLGAIDLPAEGVSYWLRALK